MRTSKLSRIFAVIATVAASASLRSQTWETILNYLPPGGQVSSGRTIAADPLGNIISGGSATDASGFDHGIVLKTDLIASAWTIGDDTNPDPNQYDSYVRSAGFDANGNCYSVGQLYPPSAGATSIPFWYVRKSSDKGLTWSTVDLFQFVQGQWVNPTGFAADDAGNVYVAGWARGATSKKTPSGNLHWLVRKSGDAGQTWNVSDDLEGPTAGFGAGGLGFVPGRGIFAVGNEFTGGTGWQVRRSTSGQFGTWLTVDGPIAGGAASAVGSDAAGNIYAVGSLFVANGTVRNKGQTTQTGYYAWATRRSIDGGNTWSTVDLFSYASNAASDANGIARDRSGNIAVAGGATDAQGRRHWIVRSPDVSGNWHTIDDFQLASGYNANASGIVTDAGGNLLVVGAAADAANAQHWIVRRLPAP
jgi:hypothetical protein